MSLFYGCVGTQCEIFAHYMRRCPLPPRKKIQEWVIYSSLGLWSIRKQKMPNVLLAGHVCNIAAKQLWLLNTPGAVPLTSIDLCPPIPAPTCSKSCFIVFCYTTTAKSHGRSMYFRECIVATVSMSLCRGSGLSARCNGVQCGVCEVLSKHISI